MRKNEINTRTVYAYERSEGLARPVRFLSTALHGHGRRRNGEPVTAEWVAAPAHVIRPKSNDRYPVGYPVVTAYARHSNSLEALRAVDAGAVITSGLTEDQINAGLRTELVFQLGKITGEYATRAKEINAARIAREASRAALEARRAESRERGAAVAALLQERGIEAYAQYNGTLVIDGPQLAKLEELLRATTR